MTERTGIIMPAFPRASKEVRGRGCSVMRASFLQRRTKSQTDGRLRDRFVMSGRSDRAVEAVSRVAEARHDVADLVELLVERAEHDRDVFALGRGPHGLEALGRADEAHRGHVDRAALEQ